MTPERLGQRFLSPPVLKKPIDQISLGLALVFGTAGLPHYSDAFLHRSDGTSSASCRDLGDGIIGGFYVLTLFPRYRCGNAGGPGKIAAVDAGGNMAARCWRNIWVAVRTRCWQLLPGLRCGSGICHDRRRGGRSGAGSCFRDGA